MLRTTVRVDPELDARAPAELPARVRCALRDGRVVEQVVYSAKGDPESPLTKAELRAKFLGMVEGTAYEAHSEALLSTITGLDGRGDVRGLLATAS